MAIDDLKKNGCNPQIKTSATRADFLIYGVQNRNARRSEYMVN